MYISVIPNVIIVSKHSERTDFHNYHLRLKYCFYKGRELVKDGKELASLFFTAPVSTCDEKRSNLLLGHFYASET